MKRPTSALTVMAITMVAAQAAPILAQGNILVIVADDFGTDKLCGYRPDCVEGSEPAGVAPTPNLDFLMDTGLRFDNAWSNPVCSTTRSTLVTGQFSRRTGILNALGENSTEGIEEADWTIPEMLETELPGVYQTAGFGKWHLNGDDGDFDEPIELGKFDYWEGTRANLTRDGIDYCDYTWWTIEDVGMATEEQNVSTYATSQTVDSALDWLRDTADPNRPWFMYVAFHAPHAPLVETLVDGVEINDAGVPEPIFSCNAADPCDDTGDPARLSECFETMVRAMDSEIGVLLNTLASIPQGPVAFDFPTIIFVGDNGTTREVLDLTVYPEIPNDNGGPPYRHAKTTVFEGGVRVPFLVGGAGVSNGIVTRGVNTTDVFLTVAELAGLDPEAVRQNAPVPLDSFSQVPFFDGSPPPASCEAAGTCRTELFAEIKGDGSVGANPRPASDALAYRSSDLVLQPFKLVRGCIDCSNPTGDPRIDSACEVTHCADEECLFDLSNGREEDTDLLDTPSDLCTDVLTCSEVRDQLATQLDAHLLGLDNVCDEPGPGCEWCTDDTLDYQCLVDCDSISQ